MKNDEDTKKQELLNQLSCEMFWSCNRPLLNYNINKKIIISKILEYGRPNDINIMLQIYSLKDIQKIAFKIDGLDDDKVVFFSKLLKKSPKKFASYGKKHWSERINNNVI